MAKTRRRFSSEEKIRIVLGELKFSGQDVAILRSFHVITKNARMYQTTL